MNKLASALVMVSSMSVSVVAVQPIEAANRFERAGRKVEVRKLERSAGWVKNLMRQARLAGKAGEVGASAIVRNSSSRQLVIPSAGSVRGANNTFYRSDVTFVNYNEEDQLVAAVWFPNGGNPDAFEIAAVTIPGGQPPFTFEDFVGAGMQLSGLGSLVFLPIAGEDFDHNAAIDIFSRIWSPQPNSNGIVSFPFPAVDFDHLRGEYEAMILGLRQDALHRTNYGIVNMSEENDLVFSLLVVNENGILLETEPFTLPAGSMVQRALPAGDFGNFSLLVSIEEDVPGDEQAWTAYASSNHNISNDGWVSIAALAFDDDDLDTAAPRN